MRAFGEALFWVGCAIRLGRPGPWPFPASALEVWK